MKQYVVGGAVRDVLLGREPKDLDYVVVGGTSNEMLSKGFTKVGADFPVFLHPETGCEYALARKERKVAAGYNGFEVEFDPSVTLEDDLVRRDLTINAMAVPADVWNKFVAGDHSLVVDPFNGRDDLSAHTLRHVSEAFAEDPVRVLRVARFAARYGFNVALETVALMMDLVDAGELDALVPERVWAECERALAEPNPMAFFVTLRMCHAEQKLFPELTHVSRLLGDADGFLEASLNHTPADAKLRFALTCLKLSEDNINTMCDRLKIPNEFRTLALRSVKFVNTLRRDLTPESVVSAFEAVGGVQDVSNVTAVLNVAMHSAYNTAEFSYRRKVVANLAPVVCGVRFADLTPEQTLTLKGPAVGAALRELRLKRAADYL